MSGTIRLLGFYRRFFAVISFFFACYLEVFEDAEISSISQLCNQS